MPWRFCSIAAAALVAACVTSTSRFYTPTEGDSRLSQDDFRDESDGLLRVECPRLMGNTGQASGQARVRVFIDRSGAAQRAEFARSSGDERLDTMWGGLAARLKFDPQAGQRGDLEPLIATVGYSCSANGTAVTTFQLPI
jgi:outer membrane biosynthesis protein TonB